MRATTQSRVRTAILVAAMVFFGLIIASQPHRQVITYREYANIEAYPDFYYASFTITRPDLSPSASILLMIDYGGNYAGYEVYFKLYSMLPSEFNESFNITQADRDMFSVNQVPEPIWEGGGQGMIGNSFEGSINAGSYVFVFWIKQNVTTSGWSATLTISEITSLLPLR